MSQHPNTQPDNLGDPPGGSGAPSGSSGAPPNNLEALPGGSGASSFKPLSLLEYLDSTLTSSDRRLLDELGAPSGSSGGAKSSGAPPNNLEALPGGSGASSFTSLPLSEHLGSPLTRSYVRLLDKLQALSGRLEASMGNRAPPNNIKAPSGSSEAQSDNLAGPLDKLGALLNISEAPPGSSEASSFSDGAPSGSSGGPPESSGAPPNNLEALPGGSGASSFKSLTQSEHFESALTRSYVRLMDILQGLSDHLGAPLANLESVLDNIKTQSNNSGAPPGSSEALSVSDGVPSGSSGTPSVSSGAGGGKAKCFEVFDWTPHPDLKWPVDLGICVICRSDLSTICNDCEEKEPCDDSYDACTIATGACNHTFHFHCIRRWLKVRCVCPLDNQAWKFKSSSA